MCCPGCRLRRERHFRPAFGPILSTPCWNSTGSWPSPIWPTLISASGSRSPGAGPSQRRGNKLLGHPNRANQLKTKQVNRRPSSRGGGQVHAMLPPRRPGYSVVLGELQDHNHQDDDHQYTDDRADQSSVHGPLLPHVLTSAPVARAAVRLPLKAILVYNVKLAWGKNSLVTLAVAIAHGDAVDSQGRGWPGATGATGITTTGRCCRCASCAAIEPVKNSLIPDVRPCRRLPTMISSASMMSASRASAYAISPASSRKTSSTGSPARTLVI